MIDTDLKDLDQETMKRLATFMRVNGLSLLDLQRYSMALQMQPVSLFDA